ncbi:C2 domain and Munc13 homology 1 domain and Mammalian uncoordinated homology 13, domain 2 and Mammalian uncoordinated homology 13, subgroup, domain 2-containing protein [Strongyloides ratti]|uniref:C2 domain and Munc13 homology 1 domain and Mammalian uncoordinated homology 13, domain 2 and Mammalian uncoordinated homology 13, subgroup, domain 2-containing protein n=1 Tax=Strongyloides ratti TaxID=34506 RepID=A0A090KTF5_STRRB|nr:C2 domain and Munc13 homology 1 domain and Mammalian uncoordinated homology 13, domain 2 and Mammalian uncoordinated homology 13, subgroup, domain 2-containing protein [Strongyloides ratti]CEF60676.1 C2 domain and Munc13 homology 1 domain and Mammalian uncoordinated homology 13, domain 2 and Mammalian uncoordinated homology 13, subgroup, domain 2-containing protein [Strongyloides ratti]
MNMDTVATNVANKATIISKKISTAGAWAGQQFSKAANYIRTQSLAINDEDNSALNDGSQNSKQVQASDNYFFEQFSPIQLTNEDSKNVDEQYTISKITINENEKHMHELYVEAMYTIQHKIGNQGDLTQSQLAKYVQSAFEVDEKLHKSLIARASRQKAPIVLLNVQLIEGKDLIAKDINGFSDPFCMMGIVPGEKKTFKPILNPEDIEVTPWDFEDIPDDSGLVQKVGKPTSPTSPNDNNKKHRLSRIGGSFRRKLVGKKNQKIDDYETTNIPAKIIKASSVQKMTLNPKWNEKFQFIVDDIHCDKFHLDIWDHDDDERSVIDAVTSLNEISGLKGLGRYFKEVTQSARAQSNESVDDFLGCVNISLSEIPPDGIEKWFELERRSEKSEVSGSIKLKLWLSTKEERVNQSDDETIDVKQHVQLIRQFALHEIRCSQKPVNAFDGLLPDPAKAILYQHAIQGDLTITHQLMCQWLAYCAMINIGINFHLLFGIANKLIDKWSPLDLDKDEENMLACSFNDFDEFVKTYLINHLKNVNVLKKSQVDRFDNILKTYVKIKDSHLYERCVPFGPSKDTFLIECLIKGSKDYFKWYFELSKEETNSCKTLLKLIVHLIKGCQKMKYLEGYFKSNSDIDYVMILYSNWSVMLDEYMAIEQTNESKSSLKQLFNNAHDGEEIVILSIMHLHCLIRDFDSYKPISYKPKMMRSDWRYQFDRVVAKWIDISRIKAFSRVDLSCKLDSSLQLTSNELKYTSSYVDICHIIDQLANIWEKLYVYDINLRADLLVKLVQFICKLAEYYIDKIMGQLAQDGFCGDLQFYLPPALVSIFCATINNAEQVRRSLVIHDKLQLEEFGEKYEKKTKKPAKFREQIENDLDVCDRYIAEQIESTIIRFVVRCTDQMKKHVFHLAWSPTACPVDVSLKPMTDLLDAELSSIHKHLLHKNFLRVMHAQIGVLIQLFDECINENIGFEPIFYQRLYDAWGVLTDYFHADGKGLSLEAFDGMAGHRKIISTLSLNKTPTIKIIEKYYSSLLKKQTDAQECKYGILNVRAYYNQKLQTLVVDVIGAKQIIPLDSNGLSDPFVVVELVPHFRFPTQAPTKTKVVSKSLNPIFNETFEFPIQGNQPPCAMIHFIVMDHDFLRSNDFAGEAFLELSEVPGFGNTQVSSTLRQFNLILIHPTNKFQDALSVLESRKDDKEAIDFLKSLSISY